MLDDYLGENQKEYDVSNLNAMNIDALFKVLKSSGADRFNSKRDKIFNMAKAISEVNYKSDLPNNSHIGLYSIFSYTAELEHNSYYNALLNFTESDEQSTLDNDSNADELFIQSIVTKFINYYNKVIII